MKIIFIFLLYFVSCQENQLLQALSFSIEKTVHEGNWNKIWKTVFPTAIPPPQQNCTKDLPSKDSLIQTILKRRQINVGFRPHSPFFFYNETTKELKGVYFIFINYSQNTSLD
jgi:hypothetical protein